MCIGYAKKENTNLTYLRKICWFLLNSYADPKKLPSNEKSWWPLAGDPKPKPFNRAKALKVHNKVMQLTFTKRG